MAEAIDLRLAGAVIDDFVAFVPDTRGFELHLARWYMQNVESASTTAWVRIPAYPDFLEYVRAVSRAYLHLSYGVKLQAHGYKSESLGKLRAVTEGLVIPRYVRDMIRELCRPMLIDDVTFQPYAPLIYRGIDPVPGVGIRHPRDRAVSDFIAHTPSLDPVPVEAECPMALPGFISNEEHVCVLAQNLPKWRFDAILILRHLTNRVRLVASFSGSNTSDQQPAVARNWSVLQGPGQHGSQDASNTLGDRPAAADVVGLYNGDIHNHDVRWTRITDHAISVALGKTAAVAAQAAAEALGATAATRRGHRTLEVALALVALTDDQINAVYDDRYLPGFPKASGVQFIWHQVGLFCEARFPSKDEGSSTPPSNPRSRAPTKSNPPRTHRRIATKAPTPSEVPEPPKGKGKGKVTRWPKKGKDATRSGPDVPIPPDTG